jgi:glycosyltransferase involved in cell wall biosynthesis
MRVLMLGWEYPPYISGGLGTACQGLSEGLGALGAQVAFVVPYPVRARAGANVRVLGTPAGKTLMMAAMPSGESATGPAGAYARTPRAEVIQSDVRATPALHRLTRSGGQGNAAEGPSGDPADAALRFPDTVLYAGDLFEQTLRYADLADQVAADEPFDVVHAHDWMTFRAGIRLARRCGSPLVVHVHSTEFDRNGDHVHQGIYEIERTGMHAADHVVTVSDYTRRVCLARYGLPEEKVTVVYNAVTPPTGGGSRLPAPDGSKTVLFLGRITRQKGPEFFLAAARRVLEHTDGVRFVMAGDGDRMGEIVHRAAEMGLGRKVFFTGFLRGADVDRAFAMADLLVMPSVSEPFGLVVLEALSRGVPVLMSKQSGVAERVCHALKVDFWDVDKMADRILAVLRRPALSDCLHTNGREEAGRFQWTDAARQCLGIYADLYRRRHQPVPAAGSPPQKLVP